MKAIIIYQGKYGATQQYAQWLAESLRLPVLNADDAGSSILASYDLIILGSSVYVGKLVIRRWLKQNLASLAGKKVFLFIVCGTTAEDKLQQQAIIRNNVDLLIREKSEVFFLPGRVLVSQLSWKDRFVLKMGAMLEKDPKKKALMTNGFDGVDQQQLSGLTERISSYQKQQEMLPAQTG